MKNLKGILDRVKEKGKAFKKILEDLVEEEDEYKKGKRYVIGSGETEWDAVYEGKDEFFYKFRRDKGACYLLPRHSGRINIREYGNDKE